MRVLLAANASYVPPRGGATRSNLTWLEQLATRGHACRVVAAALAPAPDKIEQLRDEALDPPLNSGDGLEVAYRGEIAVYASADPARRSRLLRSLVREFEPDWVLVSSEDIGQVLLREALRIAPGRVVYLAHTPQFFPFGPASWSPDPRGAELLRACAGAVAIGNHMAGYIERFGGRRPAVVHPPIYGHGPFPRYGAFDRGLITMINPCAVKGIEIFLCLARRFPQYEFGALPGWGTTAGDRRALQTLSNITLLHNTRDIEEVLALTRVLLMPSLWYEGFGLIVVEAMLRGIPVISSDFGGLEEAKMGTRFLLPVHPIERYEAVFDERGMPKPVMATQDIEPWADALDRLLSDRPLYDDEAQKSRDAALRFVSGIRGDALEQYLLSLSPAEAAAGRPAPGVLSPEKRALLLERLRKR